MGDVICPICHDKSGQFDDYGKRKRVLCHHCHSLERTRAMADMWTRYIGGGVWIKREEGPNRFSELFGTDVLSEPGALRHHDIGHPSRSRAGHPGRFV